MSVFEPVLSALEASGGRYVVVGGLATVLHGHARLTADIDVIVDFEPASLLSVLDALTDIGLVPRLPVDARELADPERREEWVNERGMRVFSFWDPDNPLREVDLFVDHPIDFEGLWQRSQLVDLDGFHARIASIEDLIDLKRLAGRVQDAQDIEALESMLAQGLHD